MMAHHSSGTRPLVFNTAETNTPADELLTNDANSINIDNDDTSLDSPFERVIANACLSALSESNLFPLGKKDIREKITNNEKGTTASHEANVNARLLSFEDFKDMNFHVLKAVTDEGTKKARRTHTVRRSPAQLAKSSLRNAQILVSDAENPLKKLLLTYAKSQLVNTDASSKSARQSFPVTASSSSTPLHEPTKLSSRERHTYLCTKATALSLLTNVAPSQSINDLAQTEDIFVVILPKDLAKEVQRSKEILPLQKLQSFSCFWCSPFVPEDETSRPIHETLSDFPPEVADTNVQRLKIYFDVDSILQHVLQDHIRTTTDILDCDNILNTCVNLLPCKSCFRGYLNNTQNIHSIFLCCLNCAFDHQCVVAAHRENPLVSLIITLREHFHQNHKVNSLIDKYFQVECLTCGHLASDMDSLMKHSRLCLAQIMSMSTRYGIPFDYEGFYSSPFMHKKEQQARHEHALSQLHQFVDAVKLTYGRTPTIIGPTSDTVQMEGKVRSLLEVEAELTSTFELPEETPTPNFQMTPVTLSSKEIDRSDDNQTDEPNLPTNYFEDDIDLLESHCLTSSTRIEPCSSSCASMNNDCDYEHEHLDSISFAPLITDKTFLTLIQETRSFVQSETDSNSDQPVSSPAKKKAKS